MPRAISIAVGLLLLGVVLWGIGWCLRRWLLRSDDPPKLVFKWILSLLFTGGLLGFAGWIGPGVGGAFTVPFVCVGYGVAMSVLWAPHVGALLAKPLTSLFDGGDQEVEPQPLYSTAQSKIKRGQYQEAAYEIKEQLARFPADVTGQVMLAELQAEHLNDLPGAQVTVERLCAQPGHAPKTIAVALNSLADWHLKYAQDVEAARLALDKIIELLPHTEEAQMACQRIAHLGTTESLLAARERPILHLRPGAQNVGLLKDSADLKKPAEDPAAQAAALVRHLEQHPSDNEARENLAWIYADHYARLDLAIDQLEQMIQQPNQPPKQVVHWLNAITDMHIRIGNDYETARQSLQRIIDLFPEQSAAENARQRLGRLRLELRANQKSQVVKLGSYEQNIGLKKR